MWWRSIERGADVHDTDDFALATAVEFGHIDVVALLIQHGADVHCRLRRNLLELGHNRDDIRALLIHHGLRPVNQEDEDDADDAA